MHRPEGDQYRILFEHSSDAHFIFDESGITDCGTMRTLQNSSFPIGIVDEATYDNEVVRLDPGDCLWLYSDGLWKP